MRKLWAVVACVVVLAGLGPAAVAETAVLAECSVDIGRLEQPERPFQNSYRCIGLFTLGEETDVEVAIDVPRLYTGWIAVDVLRNEPFASEGFVARYVGGVRVDLEPRTFSLPAGDWVLGAVDDRSSLYVDDASNVCAPRLSDVPWDGPHCVDTGIPALSLEASVNEGTYSVSVLPAS